MDSVAFSWTMAAMVLAGIQMFYQRVVAVERRDAAFNGLMMYVFSGIAGLVLFFALGLPAPHDLIPVVVIACIAGFMHAIGNYYRMEGLSHVDTVIFFPISKVIGPLLVVLGGVVWFGDALGVREYIGIALSLMVPMLLISGAEHTRQNDLRRGITYMVVSAVLTSGAMLFTKEALSSGAGVLFFLGISQWFGAIASAFLYVRAGGLQRLRASGLSRRDLYLGSIAAVLTFVSFYCLMQAVSVGLVSLVYVIHAHYILIPIVLSVWWYGDHINLRKLVAVCVSFLAIMLLYEA